MVNHPVKWQHGGYHEIQDPRERYAVMDLRGLTDLCGFADPGDFQRAQRQQVEQALEGGRALRDDRCSEAIGVGSLAFVDKVKSEPGLKAVHRQVMRLRGRIHFGNKVKLTQAI